jgi:hypothetical protein
MATEIGSLVVRIGADAEDLLRDLKKLDTGFGSMGKNVKLVHDAVVAFSSAALAAGSAVAAMVASAARSAEQMYKMAQSAGVATETMSQLAYAAALSGVNTEQLGQSLGHLNRNVADAARGLGEAGRAFAAMGLSIVNADGSLKNADQIMVAVSDKFSNMKDGAEKSALAIAIFGRAGQQMIPMLNEGSKHLAELRQEAIALGVSLSSDAGHAAALFEDNLTRLQMASKGTANALMLELLPDLIAVTNAMVANAKEGGLLRDNIKTIADTVRGVAIPVFQVLAVVGSDIAFMFRTMGGEIGVWAAQLAALARLDFKGFKVIREEWQADAAKMRADLDAFQERIMKFGEVKPDLEITAPRMTGAAPKMINVAEAEKQAKAFVDAEEQAALDASKAWDYYYQFHTSKLIGLGEMMKSTTQRENEAYQERLQNLKQFSDEELDAIGGRQAVEQRMENEHLANLRDMRLRDFRTQEEFTQASWDNQVEIISGQLVNISAGTARHNRKMFELNKAAGTTQAIISAYVGISKTLETYPYPLSIAMAALQAYAAFAQVQAIQSATFGDTAASPSLAGSTAAPAVTPVSQGTPVADRGQTTVVNIHGEVFGRKQLRDLINQINEGNRDGNQIVLGTA